MQRMKMIAAALAAACLSAPAASATVVQLPRFDAIDLEGGGRVILRHGAQQKVTIVEGDADVSRIEVDRRSLRIAPCDGRCPAGYRLVVEVGAPSVSEIGRASCRERVEISVVAVSL